MVVVVGATPLSHQPLKGGVPWLGEGDSYFSEPSPASYTQLVPIMLGKFTTLIYIVPPILQEPVLYDVDDDTI